MNNVPKRKTLADLKKSGSATESKKSYKGSSNMDDGEDVRKETKKTISGLDAGTSESKTQVYRFGKLHSSQG